MTTVILLTALAARLVSGPFGANMIAVRDNETAARVIGVPVLRTKLLAFALSSAIIAIAGVLWAFTYLRTVEPAGFNLDRSFQILFIVIIGRLASIRGAFLGAAFIVVLPLLLSNLAATLFGGAVDSGTLELVQRILLGMLNHPVPHRRARGPFGGDRAHPARFLPVLAGCARRFFHGDPS